MNVNDNIHNTTKTYVNSLYEDNIENYPCKSTSPYSGSNVTSYGTFNSVSEASQFLRKEMVNRAINISITVNAKYYDDMLDDIFCDAISYSDSFNTNEGDYLALNVKECAADIQYTEDWGKFDIRIWYLSTKDEERKVDAEVKKVLDDLNVYNKNDAIKIKAVHDYMVSNIVYDYTLTNYSAYNAIIDKSVVCQGFSSLTYRLLKELGVGVRCISGTSHGELHAWNIVKIDGKWYNIDNTWDCNDYSFNGELSYNYFLKCPADFPDHIRDNKFTTDLFNSSYVMSNKSYDLNNIGLSKDDILYSKALDKILLCQKEKTQYSIYEARKAVETLRGTGAEFAIGEFSKIIDEVQQQLFKGFMETLAKAKDTLKQDYINEAKAYVEDFYNCEYTVEYVKQGWAEAVDNVQNELISITFVAVQKAKETGNESDIKVAQAYLEDLEKSTNHDVIMWVKSIRSEYNI